MTNIVAGVATNFSVSAVLSDGSASGPYTATWNFSDNTVLTGMSVSKAFATAGPASATVTVTNSAINDTQTSSIQFLVNGSVPVSSPSPVGRVCQTMTKLNDGRILIAGGFSAATTPTNRADIFDPASKTITALPNMGTARGYHAATLLPNGKVLLSGGATNWNIMQAGVALTSCELFDPSTNTFSSTNPLPTSRAGHSTVLLPNGNVIVVGGYNDTSISIMASAGTWSQSTQTLGWWGTGILAQLLNDGTILIGFGANNFWQGFTNYASGNSKTSVYTPSSDTLTVPLSIVNNYNPFGHIVSFIDPSGAMVIMGSDYMNNGTFGTVYILGNNTVVNVAGSQTSTNRTNCIGQRLVQSVAFSSNNNPASFVSVGGYNTGGVASQDIMGFNTATYRMGLIGSLGTARYLPGACYVSDGLVLVNGGATGVTGTTLSSYELVHTQF